MKHHFLITIFLSSSCIAFSQNTKLLQKAWIQTASENLSQREIQDLPKYTRYTFDKAKLYISFYPGWDDYQQDWSCEKTNLTIGFDTYQIEALNDTALTIKLDGFRRVSFLSESYISSLEKNLDSIGTYNGKPLYKANDAITPRYTKGKSLREVIQKEMDGYNIKRAAYFLITFIVTEEGKVENIKVIKGITEGFDQDIIKHLKSTSKSWMPARYKSEPIQTEMIYEIKYLDSIVR